MTQSSYIINSQATTQDYNLTVAGKGLDAKHTGLLRINKALLDSLHLHIPMIASFSGMI